MLSYSTCQFQVRHLPTDSWRHDVSFRFLRSLFLGLNHHGQQVLVAPSAPTMAGLLTKFPNSEVKISAQEITTPLHALGLTTTVLTMRKGMEDLSVEKSDPESHQQQLRSNNKLALWVAITREELNNIRDQTTSDVRVQSLHGRQRLPRWDKLVFNTTPAGAMCTWYYHSTEQHLGTFNKELILLSWEPEQIQHAKRLSSGTLTSFSRGYCFPQFQLHAGHVYNMTKYEYESQQSWIVFSSDQLSINHCIGTYYSWSKAWAWDYNVPINLAEIKDTSHVQWPAALQALWYSGLQCLDSMDGAVSSQIKGLLLQHHPLFKGPNPVSWISYNGIKTADRLRGTDAVIAWADTMGVQEYMEEINKWRADPTSGNDDAEMPDGAGDEVAHTKWPIMMLMPRSTSTLEERNSERDLRQKPTQLVNNLQFS